MQQRLGVMGLLGLLALAGCQSVNHAGGNVSNAAVAQNNRAVTAQVAQPVEQQTLYFAADGQYSDTPVANGFYRRILGKTAAGGWVAQDFYQATKTKQVDPFVIFHSQGLRNFDNDVVDGLVVWYRPDGSRLQTQSFKQGKAEGWRDEYDASGTLRRRVAYAGGEATGVLHVFDARGHKQMVQGMNAQQQVVQTFWYDNGKVALEVVGDNNLKGWQRNGEALNNDQAVALWEYLDSLLYQDKD